MKTAARTVFQGDVFRVWMMNFYAFFQHKYLNL